MSAAGEQDRQLHRSAAHEAAPRGLAPPGSKNPAAWLLAALLLLVGAAGCSGLDDPDPATDLPALDFQTFRQKIQPVLFERCANPTTCHGVEGRPFAIYAPGANRRRSEDVFLNPPLTEREIRANYRRTVPFAVDEGSGAELLTKPLAERICGVAHEGGDIYPSRNGREFRLLEAWVQPDEGGRDGR